MVRTAQGFTSIGDIARPFLADMKRRMQRMEEGSETEVAPSESPGRPGNRRLPEENEARVVGRMVNPAKVKEGTTAKGSPYKLARLMLAVNRSYKDSSDNWVREADFIPVVLWDALAEQVSKAGKGTAMRVTGRIKTYEAEGKQYRWELKADTLEVLDWRRPAQAAPEAPQKELLPN